MEKIGHRSRFVNKYSQKFNWLQSKQFLQQLEHLGNIKKLVSLETLVGPNRKNIIPKPLADLSLNS